MSIQKIKNSNQVHQADQADQIVFKLQKQYSEKLFSKLYKIVRYQLLKYNKNSFRCLTTGDKEDVLHDILSTAIFTSIENYNGKVRFLWYINNLFRKRLITATNQSKKKKTISLTEMEKFDVEGDTSYNKSVITENKEILYKKYIESDIYNRIEKEKVEDFIYGVINSLQKIRNKNHRYIIYAFLIFDFGKLQNLINLFSELYNTDYRTIYTRVYRSYQKLSKIFNHKVDRKVMLQISRFISIKSPEINKVVEKFEFKKYNGNIMDIYKILKKIDKKRENGIHELLGVII